MKTENEMITSHVDAVVPIFTALIAAIPTTDYDILMDKAIGMYNVLWNKVAKEYDT